MRIALVSLDIRWHDRDANLKRCHELLETAREHDCDVAVFPEMTLTGFSMDANAVAEPAIASPSLDQFGRMAKCFGMHLVFGACLRTEPAAQPRNVLCHASPTGDSVTAYAKIHPFSFAGEDDAFEAGEKLGFLDLPSMRLAASICYDLRFPMLYAATGPRSEGAVCIANWPVTRVAHWRTLLVARAIENQMFMIGVNRVGIDGNRLDYPKSSMLVHPNGEVVQPLHESRELDVYEIDPAETARARADFPTVRDRRPDFYAKVFAG